MSDDSKKNSVICSTEFNNVKITRYGPMIYNPHDIYVGRSIDLYGEFSYAEAQVFEQLIKPGDVVLDLGANIGAHTLCFSKKVGLKGAVLAFEPQRIVYQQLCGNVALNSIVNTICYQKAVGETMGKIHVPFPNYIKDFNYGGISLQGVNSGEEVELITLDSLNLSRCNFIKIDVEGMELPVLKGAKRLIQQFQPAMCVENDRKHQSHDLISYLLELGYQLYWFLPRLFNPDNYSHHSENVFGQIVSVNMLCFPSRAKVNLDPRFRRINTPDDQWNSLA